VSKYKKGANIPTGVTEFTFKVADLNFHSNDYEWLVVGGPRAKYKGTETINGAGDFGFLLTAIDGQIPGGNRVDKFRLLNRIYNILSIADNLQTYRGVHLVPFCMVLHCFRCVYKTNENIMIKMGYV